MKTYAETKPVGQGVFEPISRVRYFDDEDAFEVEFASGETFRIAHADIRRANGLAESVQLDSLWIEAETRSGFLIRYTDGSMADCSWGFVKEKRG